MKIMTEIFLYLDSIIFLYITAEISSAWYSGQVSILLNSLCYALS